MTESCRGPCDADAPLLAHVFKVSTDPVPRQGVDVCACCEARSTARRRSCAGADRSALRAGHVLKVEGRDHPRLDRRGVRRRLVAVAKIDDLHVAMILRERHLGGMFTPVLPRVPDADVRRSPSRPRTRTTR